LNRKKLIQRLKSERNHIENQAKDLGLIFNQRVSNEMVDTLVEMVSRINRYVEYQRQLNEDRLDEAFTDRMKSMLMTKMKDEDDE